MCFKKKHNKPIRLEKKKENEKIKFMKNILKSKEFWILTIITLIFIIAIIFAIKESISYLVYNNGGLF